MSGPLLVVCMLIVSPVLAGCIGGDDEAPAPALAGDVPLPPLSFGPEVAMEQDDFGAEPNIAIAPDGTLFIASVVGASSKANVVEGAAWLWRSRDAGATWETLRSPAAPATVPVLGGAFCSCDADVTTSPDGWVYYSDWWIAGFVGPGNYLVERSSDGGDTWEATPITTVKALLPLVDRQWLLAGPDGFVGLFYHYTDLPTAFTDGTSSRIEAVFSTDHGATWGLPVVTTPFEANVFHAIGHPRLLPDGTIIMPYGAIPTDGDFWTAPSTVRVAISGDGGASWESVDVAEAPEGFDNLWAVQGATDDAGNAYVVWGARTGERMGLFVSESPDGGRNWTEPLAVRSEGINFLPWAAATGDGHVALGWYGSDATGAAEDAAGDTPWYAYGAVRHAAGEDFVVSQVSAEPVKTGALCAKGSACGEDRELLDYVSLVFDAGGRIHYAFARSVDDGGSARISYAASQLPDAVAPAPADV